MSGCRSNWDIEGTDEFVEWFGALTDGERHDVARKVDMLEKRGPSLGRPYVDTLRGSRHANMKELRIKREQIRVFFAFDPRRTGILLVGGAKVGNDRFYEVYIPVADALYDKHLQEIKDDEF